MEPVKETGEDGTEQVTGWEQVEEKFKHAKKFLDAEAKFDLPDANLAPGAYEIPVQFILPDKLPSSFNFKSKSSEKQKAKVKYIVKTEIIGLGDDDVMKYKQVLIIHEPPVEL